MAERKRLEAPTSDEPRTKRAETVKEAHHDSNIDGWGDEGRGYDYDYFAQRLEDLGWVWKGRKR